ncbi:MAG: FecR domain-containing protein [Chloroflexales bacterium]|nr:FecR domain-containing protein [Chloroflexales bacterium]
MRRPSWIAAVTVLVPLALLVSLVLGEHTGATAMPDWRARVEAVSGKASWRSPLADREWFRQQHGGREWVPVKRSDSYGPEIRLRTGGNSTLALRLADGSQLTLLANTEVELVTLRDEVQQGVTRIRLARGMVEVIANQPAAENAFLVETRAGAMTVGTAALCIRHREPQTTPAPCGAPAR